MDALPNVNTPRGGSKNSYVGLTSNVSPEVQSQVAANSHTGVSSDYYVSVLEKTVSNNVITPEFYDFAERAYQGVVCCNSCGDEYTWELSSEILAGYRHLFQKEDEDEKRNDNYVPHPIDTKEVALPEELAETEKEYDRKTSLETLKLIMKLGFKIIKEK